MIERDDRGGWKMASKKRESEEKISEEFSYVISRQMGKMERIFSWMAHCFFSPQMDGKQRKEEEIINILDEINVQYCENCSKQKFCRNKIGLALQKKGYVEEEDIVSFLTCHGGEAMREEINQRYRRSLYEIRARNQMELHRQFLSDQYEALAGMMKVCMEQCRTANQLSVEEAEPMVVKEAKSYGILMKEIRMDEKEGHMELRILLKMKKGERTSKEIARILSEIYGKRLKPKIRCKSVAINRYDWMEFIEETRFYVLTGAIRKCSRDQRECGEQFALEQLENDQFLAAVCDGLGTGRQAGQESQRVIELMEKLLENGISSEVMVKLVQSSMMFSLASERYVALDALILDLHTGIGKVIKMGAAESFIIREDGIEILGGEEPPVGIDCLESPIVRKKFNHGDMIVIVSDGVLDEFGGKERFAHFLLEQRISCPQKLCHQVEEKLVERKDDCTMLAIGIWNK